LRGMRAQAPVASGLQRQISMSILLRTPHGGYGVGLALDLGLLVRFGIVHGPSVPHLLRFRHLLRERIFLIRCPGIFVTT
jgi:hypothetical protein